MFTAGLSARPARVTPVLAPVSAQRRSHPKAAELSWEKLFPYGQLELSLLQLLHGVTLPFPEHPVGLWAFPRGTRKPLGNLWGTFVEALLPQAGVTSSLSAGGFGFLWHQRSSLRREKWRFKQINQQLHGLKSFHAQTRSEHYATKSGQVEPF